MPVKVTNISTSKTKSSFTISYTHKQTKQTKQNKSQNKSEAHVQEVAIDKVLKLAVDHVVDLVIKSRLIAEAKCMTESRSSQ